MIEVVARGMWVYADTASLTVRVVRTDFDFWFDVGKANGDLEDGERPALNEEGWCYYVCHKTGWEPGQPFWPDSLGFGSVAAAKVAAEAKVPGVVAWV